MLFHAVELSDTFDAQRFQGGDHLFDQNFRRRGTGGHAYSLLAFNPGRIDC